MATSRISSPWLVRDASMYLIVLAATSLTLRLIDFDIKLQLSNYQLYLDEMRASQAAIKVGLIRAA